MRLILCILTAFVLTAPVGVAHADPDSIIGSWSGSGTARPKGGQAESVRCRVSYKEGSGRTYVLSANCATTGGTFQQSGRVVALGGNRYSGHIYSNQYNATGEVSVVLNGNRQTIRVSSDKGSASVTLRKQ